VFKASIKVKMGCTALAVYHLWKPIEKIMPSLISSAILVKALDEP